MLAYIKMPAMKESLEIIQTFKSTEGYNRFEHQEIMIVDPLDGISLAFYNKTLEAIVLETKLEIEVTRENNFTTALVYDIDFTRLTNTINDHGFEKIWQLKVNNMLAWFMVSDARDSITHNAFDIYHRNRKFQIKEGE